MDAGMLAYMRATTTVAGQAPSFERHAAVDFPLGTILAGLAVVILAEVFRAGAISRTTRPSPFERHPWPSS